MVLLSFLVAACTNPSPLLLGDGQYNEIGSTQGNAEWPSLPNAATISLPVSFPQQEDQCGPAALATMLAARGVLVEPSELRHKLYIPGKQGTLTTEMVARARRYGLLVYPLKPQLQVLLREVSEGNPVLVFQNLGFDWRPRWHFSVVTAYDLQEEKVTLTPGLAGDYDVGISLFEKTWLRAGGWAVVMMPPDQPPFTAQASVFLKAANELERVGETGAALAAYKAMMARWPANDLAYFGAGNSAYARGDYANAQGYFQAYLERSPDSSSGWNNLAYSLAAVNCHHGAMAAMACAMDLAPGNEALLASFEEIRGLKGQRNQAPSCTIPQC